MTYRKAFDAAVAATHELGCAADALAYTPQRWFNPAPPPALLAGLQWLLQQHQYQPTDVVDNCAIICQRMKPIVEDTLHCPVAFTIGWFEVDGSAFYQCSFEELRALMDTPAHAPRSAQFHTWLTLPSMEIFDPVAPTTFAVRSGRMKGAGGLIMKEADALKDMRYVPVVTGLEALERLAGGWRAL
jgi:hypothetical protein